MKARELERIATEAKREAAVLRESQQPRTLGAEQRRRFLQAVQHIPKGRINPFMALTSDPESMAYAGQLNGLLTEAGFQVEQLPPAMFFGAPIIGIRMAVKSQTEVPLHAGPLQQALRQIGIEASAQVKSELPPDSVKIIVGHKPAPQNP